MDSEALAHAIIEATPDAVIFAGRDGAIQLWNGGAEALFGHTAEEALGQSLDLIIPERLRPRHWEGYDKVLETGVTKYGRELLAVPGVRKDGSRMSLEFSIAPLHDEGGAITGFAAIMRNVTERWEQDRALHARLRELEVRAESGEATRPA